MKTNTEQISKQVAVIRKKLFDCNGFIDLEEICRLFRPSISTKTAKDRILKIRNSEEDLYLLEHKKHGYKLIKRVEKTLLFQIEESENIGQFSVGNLNPLYERRILENITQLHLAMLDKCYVEILNYTPVAGGKNKDYFVAPLTMVITNTPFVRAYDRIDNKIKQFNIDRIGEIDVSEEKLNAAHLKILNQEVVDDFGFHTDKIQLWEIELLLTNYAKTMFIRDHNHLNDKIKKVKPDLPPETINGEEFYFQYSIKLKVGSIRVIGRLMTGILSHVRVKNAPGEFRVALKEYIQKTVINVLNQNI